MLTSALEQPVFTAHATGDDAWFRRWRQVELARVAASGTTYLDYTGAALYPDSLVRRDCDRMLDAVLGNPHSDSLPSRDATNCLEDARAAILAFVNAPSSDFDVILTANTTAACRLVGEGFPFGPHAPLVLSADNHNSVNGIREFARAARAPVHVIPIDESLALREPDNVLAVARGRTPGLLAFPAQSNFSGARHPLALVDAAHANGFRVLLDAAAFLPTGELDLSATPADFVALSLYKIAGYPTGLGALIARKEALAELHRPWFAGGTVDWVTVARGRHQLRDGPERFEDGTPPFLAAGAVRPALAAVIYADRPRLARHLEALTLQLLSDLSGLRHSNGNPLVAVHGPTGAGDRGATVALTLTGADGTVIPFWDVEAAARDAGIAVRGGCFCNPGCAERAFALGDGDVHLEALGRAFSIPAFARRLGNRPVGAIRLSMGLGSLRDDVDTAIGFLARYLA